VATRSHDLLERRRGRRVARVGPVLTLTMPNCLVIQHVAPESAFTVEEALRTAGVHVDVCRVFAGDAVPPDTAGLDGVVVMGGPMSATSSEGFPSRDAEVTLLDQALRAGIPTLGICLGAQLLAVAAGSSVSPNLYGPEIGWAPIHLAPPCQDDRLFTDLPATLTVLHWHGETFELPSASQLLMSSEAYPNQAFRIGDVAWGVQFHLEVTVEAVEGLLEAFPAEADGAPGGAAAIAKTTSDAVDALTPARDLVCSRFADLVAARVIRRDLVELE
jgi:GMP synthase-like glutamine amidotransferase